jgi:hypothetical protein
MDIIDSGCKIVGLDASSSALIPGADFCKILKTSSYIKSVYAPGDPNPKTQIC